jgi:hypothetical protein
VMSRKTSAERRRSVEGLMRQRFRSWSLPWVRRRTW